uniref:Bromo domain-containing protein n=1 Tax=Arcella intermedia TaxID=1963864 RepID=A0A6B2L2X0_9EUKA
MHPPLTSIPEGNWYCPNCTKQQYLQNQRQQQASGHSNPHQILHNSPHQPHSTPPSAVHPQSHPSRTVQPRHNAVPPQNYHNQQQYAQFNQMQHQKYSGHQYPPQQTLNPRGGRRGRGRGRRGDNDREGGEVDSDEDYTEHNEEVPPQEPRSEQTRKRKRHALEMGGAHLRKPFSDCHKILLSLIDKAPLYLCEAELNPDYQHVGSCPLDLFSVGEKLVSDSYKSIEEFAVDVNSIWESVVRFYNNEGLLSKHAVELSAIFQEQLKQLKKTNGLNSSPIHRGNSRTLSPSIGNSPIDSQDKRRNSNPTIATPSPHYPKNHHNRPLPPLQNSTGIAGIKTDIPPQAISHPTHPSLVLHSYHHESLPPDVHDENAPDYDQYHPYNQRIPKHIRVTYLGQTMKADPYSLASLKSRLIPCYPELGQKAWQFQYVDEDGYNIDILDEKCFSIFLESSVPKDLRVVLE